MCGCIEHIPIEYGYSLEYNDLLLLSSNRCLSTLRTFRADGPFKLSSDCVKHLAVCGLLNKPIRIRDLRELYLRLQIALKLHRKRTSAINKAEMRNKHRNEMVIKENWKRQTTLFFYLEIRNLLSHEIMIQGIDGLLFRYNFPSNYYRSVRFK